MASHDMTETTTPTSSLLRSLVVNQTIGVLAVAGLVATLFRSARIQALVSRTSLGAHVSEWLVSKASGARPVDILFVVAMIILMVVWTAVLQRVFAHRGAVSGAEWRPETSGQVSMALYLVIAASVVEEVVFRGIVLPAGVYYLGTYWGLAGSAVLFALLHFEKGRLGQLVVLGYGLILGGGLLLGSSLLACVLAHAGGNALAFFLPEKFGPPPI
jgi:membrane protease YdiL (CAAX protease family)